MVWFGLVFVGLGEVVPALEVGMLSPRFFQEDTVYFESGSLLWEISPYVYDQGSRSTSFYWLSIYLKDLKDLLNFSILEYYSVLSTVFIIFCITVIMYLLDLWLSRT